MRLKFHLLHILIIVATLIGKANTSIQKLPFSQFNTSNGLISNRIYAIQQDKDGFIWVATDFGLERFDGLNFKLLDQKSYPEMWRNDILFLLYNKSKNLLTLGGSNGFVMDYDINNDSFTDIMPPEQEETNYKHMQGAYTNEKGERFLYGNCGFYKQNANTGIFQSVFDPLLQIKSGIIDDVYQDRRGRYWLTSVNELAIFSSNGDPLKHIEIDKEKSCIRSTILPLKDGNIVVSISDKELWHFDCNRDEITQPEKHQIPFSCIAAMLTDSRNRTWFATDGEGLWYTEHLFDPNSPFVKVEPKGKEANHISKIYALTEDKEGSIWIGTQNAGLWRTSPYKKQDITYSGDLGFPKVVCSSFTEDEAGNLIIATDGNGIYKMGKDDKFKHFPNTSNNFTHICRTTKGEILGTTWGNGIELIDPATGKGTRYKTPGLANPSNNLFSITSTSNGEVWAAPGNDDLYHKTTDNSWQELQLGYDSLSYWPNKWHLRVVEGKSGTRWALTTNSVWRIDQHGKKALMTDLSTVKSHNPLSLNDGASDKNGDLYLATNIGILHYPATGFNADTLDLVQHSNVHALCFDNNGKLWAACDNGIWQIDVEKRTSRILPNNYNDLAKSYFYDRSGFVSRNGNVYFGSNGGFFRFDCNALMQNDSLGYFGFSSLYIGQEKIQPGQKELTLGPLNTLAKLELAHDRTNIAIAINYIDFSELGNADIRYRLTGLHDEWLPLTGNRIIDFNYLPTGNYVLEVEVQKIGDQQSSKNLSLPIKVLPPWWQTWWFIVLVLLSLAGLATFAYNKRVNYLRQQRAILKAKVEEQTITLRKMVLEKDRLIAVIAHDLKSPIFGIVGSLENWLNKYRHNKEEIGQGVMEKTYGSAAMLQSTLLGLIDWAHSKEMECRITETDLPQQVKNAYELQLSRSNNKNLKITFDLAFTHHTKADERMLNTVLRNLLSNAIKFSFRNGTIDIKGWEENGNSVLSIADHGTGMTAEQLALLNKQHYCQSTEGTEQEKGSGLGLSLCHEYLERCNGQMTIDSKEGQGTTITIVLPAGQQLLAERTEEEGSQQPNAISIPDLLQGNTILVVDDDTLISQNIATLLQPYMQVLTADNGQEALEKIEANTVDIVLSDVEMPVMSGLELCKQVVGKSPHIPFLFVSARTEDDDKIMGLQSGAIDYIAKPFNNQALLLKLSNILLNRQMCQKAILQEKIGKDEKGKTEQTSKEKEAEPINPFVEKFLALIEANYSNNLLSVDMLAKEMAVSQSTLGRKLKSLLGKTAVDILTDYRLNKAKTLLKENKNTMQIGDIAFRVGFSDPSYFSKKFKEYFGYSPSEEE